MNKLGSINVSELPKNLRDAVQPTKMPLFQFPNVKDDAYSYNGFVFNENGKHLTLTLLHIKKAYHMYMFRIYILGLVFKFEVELKG